ncbi:MAG: ParB/RepB/Spo0J family partition protein [Candidatus Competibacteraceae bacterium]|jgi:ParB family chromosome partitioning protein|nr:ParB/RepB/Spo0J family partition protein [Candidatus Competibacteraceae bacterium]
MNPPKGKRKDFFFGTSPDFPKIVELNVSDIRSNPDQPRKTFREESLAELTASIERHGLIQPITVKRQEDGMYLLVAGERRFRAFERLGRETIPAIITMGDAEEIALIENIQREDLNPLEEAEAMARMMERHQYTQEQLGQIVGKSQANISKALGILTLPQVIKTEYRTQPIIGKWMLIEIAQMKSEADQVAAWEAIKEGRLATVKTVKSVRFGKKHSVSNAPVVLAVKTGKRFLKALEDLETPTGIALSLEEYRELAMLKDEIIATLQALAPENP